MIQFEHWIYFVAFGNTMFVAVMSSEHGHAFASISAFVVATCAAVKWFLAWRISKQ